MFEITRLLYFIAHCLLWSKISITVCRFKFNKSVRKQYCHEANLPALTSCQAPYVLCSRISQKSNKIQKSQIKKKPLLLVLVLDQTFIHVKGHVPILNLAIVQVFKLTHPLCGYIKKLNLAIVQVYSNKLPAYLQEIHT